MGAVALKSRVIPLAAGPTPQLLGRGADGSLPASVQGVRARVPIAELGCPRRDRWIQFSQQIGGRGDVGVEAALGSLTR
jgi:hypothetical protein